MFLKFGKLLFKFFFKKFLKKGGGPKLAHPRAGRVGFGPVFDVVAGRRGFFPFGYRGPAPRPFFGAKPRVSGGEKGRAESGERVLEQRG